jgi:hypothetical protein
MLLLVADKINKAVVTAIKRVCNMYMQRDIESPPTQLTAGCCTTGGDCEVYASPD